MATVGQLVLQRRKLLNWTQEQLARHAGGHVTVSGIGKIERGEVAEPHPSTLAALGRALGINLIERSISNDELRGWAADYETLCNDLAYAETMLSECADAAIRFARTLAPPVDPEPLHQFLNAPRRGDVAEALRFAGNLQREVRAIRYGAGGLPQMPQPAAPSPSTASAPGTTASTEARALAILIDHPDWTVEQIAKAAGCVRSTVYRMPRFRDARKAMESGRSELPRGSKDQDSGRVQAWDE